LISQIIDIFSAIVDGRELTSTGKEMASRGMTFIPNLVNLSVDSKVVRGSVQRLWYCKLIFSHKTRKNLRIFPHLVSELRIEGLMDTLPALMFGP